MFGREPRVIEIATDIYNSDCQRSILQTLSTASAAATALQDPYNKGQLKFTKKSPRWKREKGHTDWINRAVPVANQMERFDSV